MKRFTLPLLVMLMLILPNITLAQCQGDFSVRTGAWSEHHISSERDNGIDWNETHNAFGIECNHVGVMYFTNSWDEDTVGVYYDLDLINFSDSAKLGVHAGFWGGYQEILPETGGVLPVLIPKLEFRPTGYYDAGPTVEILLGGAVTVVSLKWHFR